MINILHLIFLMKKKKTKIDFWNGNNLSLANPEYIQPDSISHVH